MIVQLEYNGERDFCKVDAYKFKRSPFVYEHTEYILTFMTYEDKILFYDNNEEYQYTGGNNGSMLLDVPDDETLALVLLGS